MNRSSSIRRCALGAAMCVAAVLVPFRIADAAQMAASRSVNFTTEQSALRSSNSSRPGCKPVTFAKGVTGILEAADAALPSLDFACSVHVGIKKSGVAVAISVLGRELNPKVARYAIVAKRVGPGSITVTVSVQPPAQVLRRQLRPLVDGIWSVTIGAFSSDGTSMGSWTSSSFIIS
jgi:hypothetical protein